MRGMRVVLAGIVGGVVMFMWGFVSHMVLPFGEMGVENLPDEAVLVPAMKASINHRGFYFFPGMESNANEAEQKAWGDKYSAGPRGVLIYDPEPGVVAMDPKMLGIEFGSNVIAAVLAAVVLAMVSGGIGRRAIAGSMLGLISFTSIDVSYWNWYRFPDAMIEGEFCVEVIGWVITGLAIAMVLGSAKKAAAPAA
jgi:hypothetical protein